MDSSNGSIFWVWKVSPFGNLRIKGYLLLPAAYRSLSRPSSAPSAKAFPLCSYQLGLLLKSSNLVLKFVASLHANRKSFEVFPLPFTFVMILLWIYLFYGKTFNNLNIIKNLPVSVVYAFFNTRIRSICFLLFIFQCSFSALNTDQHNIYPYIAFIVI